MAADESELRAGWRLVPSPTRVGHEDPNRDAILERHRASVDAGVPTYADPVSGFSVFTSVFLESRQYCCDSGCRHCPYVSGRNLRDMQE